MPRTLDEIVQEYVDYLDQQEELANDPGRPLEGEELTRVLAELDRKLKEKYPNGLNSPEVQQAADRWEETENVAQGVLELLAENDQQAAKIESLQDDKERLEAELQQVKEFNKYLRNLVKDMCWPKHN